MAVELTVSSSHGMGAISLAIATVLTGQSAGLLYGWRVSVIPGTKLTSSASYIETMQSVNRAILNPAFFVVFLGSPVAITVAGILAYTEGDATQGALLIAALVTYLLTTLATTAAGNIPLNNTLERFDPVNRTPAEIDAARREYERPWNWWHNVRTVSSTVAFILCVVAAFV